MSPTTTRVPPILRLAVLCEDVEEDGAGRPFRLVVPVHTLRFAPNGQRHYRPPTLKLYLQLQGGVGTFYIWAAMREEGEATEVYRTRNPYEGAFDDDTYRIIPLELALDLPGLSFPRPGAYELLVHANYVNLHDPKERLPVNYPPIRVTALAADGSEGGML
jgi:hypothetical protein